MIVEDDPAIRLLLNSYFSNEGYGVLETDNSATAIQLVQDNDIQLALIDIVLSEGDGLLLTRELRSLSNIGIILISQKDHEIDRIVGIEMGADAYISKPFNPREVLAYSKNIIRRAKVPVATNNNKHQYELGDFRLDYSRRSLYNYKTQHQETLTRDEFMLLEAFVKNPQVILSRDKLLNLMHGHDWLANDRTIDILVGRLRKKLGDNAQTPKYIITIYGQGYIFNHTHELDQAANN